MLIIYAHPNKTGHCGSILQEITTRLQKQKIEFELLDLYKINYDPVLKPTEHYTSGQQEISPKNQKIQALIKKENQFIFIYPTWWQNMPAILKGFIDRVFVSHFAFEYDGKIPCGLLQGKAVAFTATGAPKIFSYLFTCRRSLKVLTRDALKFCGLKSRGYFIGSARELNDKQKQKIKKMVDKGLNFLSN